MFDELLAKKDRPKDINLNVKDAKELRITEQGVKRLLSSVYRKIGTDNTGLARDLDALSRS